MQTALTVTIIVVAILALLLILAAARENREHGHRGESRDDRGGLRAIKDVLRGRSDLACSSPGDRPHPPRDVCCDSDERFTVSVNWKPSASANVDHYVVYLKYLKECDAESGPHSGPNPTSLRLPRVVVVIVAMALRARRLATLMDAPACVAGRSRLPAPIPLLLVANAAPPHNYDRTVKVAGCDDQVIIRDVRKKAVCVTVSAVSRCGRESEAALLALIASAAFTPALLRMIAAALL